MRRWRYARHCLPTERQYDAEWVFYFSAQYGNTALIIAIRESRKGVAKRLLESNADVDAANNVSLLQFLRLMPFFQNCQLSLLQRGGTALHFASELGDTDAMELLLAHGADVNPWNDREV